MNALIVLSFVAAASAQLAAPYGALPYGAYAGAFPYAAGYGTPLAYNAAPLAAPLAAAAPVAAPVAPITAPSSQFQAQDEFGNINYGYSNINSAKQEVGNTYGGVTGSYSYVDANGIPQRVDYIADGLGFRVKATNLPVAPATPLAAPLEGPVFTGVAPLPVEDTAEVKAAKAEFQAAFDAAASRSKRSADALYAGLYPYAGYNNFAYSGLYNGYFGGLVAHPNGAVVPVDEPAVAAKKAEHFAAKGLVAPYAAAGLPYAGYGYNALAAPAVTYAAPAAYAAPVAAAPLAAAPLAAPAAVAAAPGAREAILTKIKLNPGHAIAYRVD